MAEMKDEDLHFMRVTTLTDFLLLSLIFKSLRPQISSDQVSLGVELDTQVYLPPLSTLFGERWVCSVSSFPAVVVVSVKLAPRILLTGSAWSIAFPWKRDQPIPGASLGDHTSLFKYWQLGRAVTSSSVPLMENCLDGVYSFTERQLTLQLLCILMTVLSSSSALLRPRTPYALLARTHHCNAGLRVCTSD